MRGPNLWILGVESTQIETLISYTLPSKNVQGIPLQFAGLRFEEATSAAFPLDSVATEKSSFAKVSHQACLACPPTNSTKQISKYFIYHLNSGPFFWKLDESNTKRNRLEGKGSISKLRFLCSLVVFLLLLFVDADRLGVGSTEGRALKQT